MALAIRRLMKMQGNAGNPADLEQLLSRYDRPGPRYTSYPTAREFHPGVGEHEYVERLQRLGDGAPLCLYIHVPFCEHRCTYCGCHVIPTLHRSIADTYVERLGRELQLVRRKIPGRARVAAIHLGGGTPTYLSPARLAELLGSVRQLFEVEGDAELAVEIDPRVTEEEHLDVLRAEGVNRISLGVQDTSAEVQQAIGRFQTTEQTRRLFLLAREKGFAGINIDLVYGLPLQTPERFRKTLRDVLELRPDRIAAFGYAHVPWIRPNQKRIDEASLPGPLERLRLCMDAHREATAAGYRHIGMDHFALPGDDLAKAQETGRLGRSFMGYVPRNDWMVLGLGVSSIGDLGDGYFQNEKKLSRYFERIEAGALPVERGYLLDHDDRLRRSVIQDILCRLRIDFRELEQRTQMPFHLYFSAEIPALRALEKDGLITLGEKSLEVLPAGRLLLRNIAMAFDRHLRTQSASAPAYSRTV